MRYPAPPARRSKPTIVRLRAIAGHTIDSINAVLDRHTKPTADQAGAALAKRPVHKGQLVEGSLARFVGRWSRTAQTLVEKRSERTYIDRHKMLASLLLASMVPPVGLEPTLP